MKDQDKTKEQLISEVEELRRQVSALEGIESQREQAERESAKNKAVVQATIDSLPFDFFAIGTDGRYIMQNATSRERWGEIIGQRPEEISKDKDNLDIWLDNNRRAFEGGQIDEEVTLTFEGKKRFCHNVIAPIRGENTTYGILGMNIDITDRKRAEEALVEREAQLLEAQEVANLGFYIVDLTTGRITTSAVLDRICGIPADYEGRSTDGQSGTPR